MVPSFQTISKTVATQLQTPALLTNGPQRNHITTLDLPLHLETKRIRLDSVSSFSGIAVYVYDSQGGRTKNTALKFGHVMQHTCWLSPPLQSSQGLGLVGKLPRL